MRIKLHFYIYVEYKKKIIFIFNDNIHTNTHTHKKKGIIIFLLLKIIIKSFHIIIIVIQIKNLIITYRGHTHISLFINKIHNYREKKKINSQFLINMRVRNLFSNYNLSGSSSL